MAENAHCFEQPHWRVIARGLQPEDWFENDIGTGTGGIKMPRPVDLPPAHRYYRFASSTTSKDAQVGGGWWMEFEAFNHINQYAKRNNLPLSNVARLLLALPYDWTRVDRLVSAILEVPLKAYSGYGNVADGNPNMPNNRWTPPEYNPIRQLYIPGLYIRGQRPPHLYERAFPKPLFEFIHGNRRPV